MKSNVFIRALAMLLVTLMVSTCLVACNDAPAVEDSPTKNLKATESTEPTASKPAEKETAPTESKNSTDVSKPSGSTKQSTSNGKAPDPSEPSESQKPSNQGSTSPTTKPSENPKPTTKPTAHTHSYSTTTVAPTCTAEGYTKHTCSCGEVYNDGYAAALGHSYTDTVVEATTTSGGYTTHTCSRCGDTYTDNYTEQLWWDTEETVAAICAEANAYAESIGFTIDAERAQSWAAPAYTHWEGSSPEWLLKDLKDCADLKLSLGWKFFYASYEERADGGFTVYGMWG